MIQYLCMQSTYTSLEIALFSDQKMFTFASEDKVRASKNVIPLIAYTLEKVGIALEKLSFIAVNQGPGPFTTLRVAIATANGISFASKIPLIGTDALDVFLQEHAPVPATAETAQPTLVLFNACNNDVYFAWQQSAKNLLKGYKNIDTLLAQVYSKSTGQKILFMGNGVALHQQKIKDVFGAHAHIPEPLPVTTSIEQMGTLALKKWHAKEGLATQLMPLYLKQAL